MLERLNYRVLIIYIITLVCMGIFVLRYEHIRKRDTEDAKNLFWILVLIVAGMVVDRSYWLLDPAVRILDEKDSFFLTDTFNSFLYFVKELLILQSIFFWNRFVDYAVYRSFDHVKKKYRRTFIPAMAIAVLLIGFRLLHSPHYRESSNPFLVILDFFGFVCYILEFYYVANAIWIGWKSTKERKAPTFLRMTVFVIPLILGFVLNYSFLFLPESVMYGNLHLMDWLSFDTRFPFLLIAVILTWRTVEKRYRYMDPINGFYNKEFLSDMNSYMEKNGYPNGVGVYFGSPGSKGKLIPVLNQLKPIDSEIFSLGEDEYLLMAGPQKQSVLRLLVKSVELGLAQNDKALKVKSAFAIRNQDESVETFTKRLLELNAE